MVPVFYALFGSVHKLKYNLAMNYFLRCGLCAVLSFSFFLQGCAYHGKIHRGIYHHSDFEEKINARVMVVSGKFFPEIISADGFGKYNYRLTDGLPVAVADALGTLFTEVEVNEYKYRKNYDFIVEVDYVAHIGIGPSRFTVENVLVPLYSWQPIVQTNLTLTVRNPRTGYAVARFDETAYSIVPTSRTDTGLAVANFFKLITLGLLTPLETQLFGAKLRKILERGISRNLYYEIMPQMKDDRVNFTREHETETTNVRVDGKFIPFMQATVYIVTDNSLGSGFFISPDGYIVTNAHVVGQARDVGVVLYDNQAILDKTSPDAKLRKDTVRNKVRFAKVLKTNRTRDLALLKMEGEHFPWLELETDRSAYTTGKPVVAIGAPRGIEWTATQGVLSAARDTNGVDTLQTDTAINGGNSGGPLIDLQTGKVLGVNSWGLISEANLRALQRGTHGLNFAVSAFEVQRTLGVTQPVNPDDFAHPED